MSEKKPRPPQFRYQDQPQLAETYADGVGNWQFDGQMLRMEFIVNRLDADASADAPTGRKVPVSRLVMSTKGAIELLNYTRQLTAALEKAGFIQTKQADPVPQKQNEGPAADAA